MSTKELVYSLIDDMTDEQLQSEKLRLIKLLNAVGDGNTENPTQNPT